MSRNDEHDTRLLNEHEIERYMTTFQASVHAMDADPAEASRIGRLAGKTDAQTLGGWTPAEGDDTSLTGQDLATLLAQPQSELEGPRISLKELWPPAPPPPPPYQTERHSSLIAPQAELDREWPPAPPEPLPPAPPPPYQTERHSSLIAPQAELDRERIRGEAELVLRKAELDAELIRGRAELDAEQRLAQAASMADGQRPRAVPRRGWLMSAPVLAIAVLAALSSGLWHGSLSPLVSIILASAAAAFTVAYSAAILISVLRLVFSSHRSLHPGAETALRLLVGAGSTRRGRVPPE